jgi:hypothetical protein
MANRDGVPLSEVKSLLNGARILAISFGGDDSTTELAYRSGAVKLLDKMNLSEELIPTILEIASRVGDGTKFEGKPN